MELISLKAKEICTTSGNTLGNSLTKFLRNLPSDLKCDITSPSCKGRIKIQLSRLRKFSRSSSHYNNKDIQIPSKHNKIYYTLPLLDYMFRLLGVIIRSSSELIQNGEKTSPKVIQPLLWQQHAATDMKPRGRLPPNTIPGKTSNAAGFS